MHAYKNIVKVSMEQITLKSVRKKINGSFFLFVIKLIFFLFVIKLIFFFFLNQEKKIKKIKKSSISNYKVINKFIKKIKESFKKKRLNLKLVKLSY